MDLNEYIWKTETTLRNISLKLDCSHSGLSYIRKKLRSASLLNALKIISLTKGDVQMEDLLSDKDSQLYKEWQDREQINTNVTTVTKENRGSKERDLTNVNKSTNVNIENKEEFTNKTGLTNVNNDHTCEQTDTIIHPELEDTIPPDDPLPEKEPEDITEEEAMQRWRDKHGIKPYPELDNDPDFLAWRKKFLENKK